MDHDQMPEGFKDKGGRKQRNVPSPFISPKRTFVGMARFVLSSRVVGPRHFQPPLQKDHHCATRQLCHLYVQKYNPSSDLHFVRKQHAGTVPSPARSNRLSMISLGLTLSVSVASIEIGHGCAGFWINPRKVSSACLHKRYVSFLSSTQGSQITHHRHCDLQNELQRVSSLVPCSLDLD